MTRPSRATTAGRVYLDLQARARRERRPTDELLVLYVLERFLYRVSRSVHRRRLILKGGMLLAALDTRRPTRDVDLLARTIPNDAPYGDLDSLNEALGASDVAALPAEVIPATAGFPSPPDGFYPRVWEIRDRHDALLVADEVQTGTSCPRTC